MNRIKQLIEKGHAFEQSQDWEAAFTCYKEASELGTANWRYYQKRCQQSVVPVRKYLKKRLQRL